MITIAWSEFTPWSALGGGVLIGIGVSVLLLFNGRIAGISGIIGGLASAARSDRGWRLSFLAGLLIAPLIWALLRFPIMVNVDVGWIGLVVAGLLVGYGTRLGSGCTSGHGVCGLARLSSRSLAATLAFMAAGFVTVYLARHLLGLIP